MDKPTTITSRIDMLGGARVGCLGLLWNPRRGPDGTLGGNLLRLVVG